MPAERAASLRQQLAAQLPEGELNQWLLGQVRAGLGQVMPETRELFIPQMLNLQAVGGVSFKKGCYTGQEIVARMQYLGKLKRRLYRLALPGDTLPVPALRCSLPATTAPLAKWSWPPGRSRAWNCWPCCRPKRWKGANCTWKHSKGQPCNCWTCRTSWIATARSSADCLPFLATP